MSANGTRRQWGWHPLRPDWARRIVDGAAISPGDLVLDLGAGAGALTGPLLDAGARVVAVELHGGRVAGLRERFGDRVTVVRADLRELRLPRRPFRVVASPPYAASTDVVRTLLRSDRLVAADLVLQRATAHRLATRPPRARHSARFRLDVVRLVPRSAFRPPPRVDSAVLRISRRRVGRVADFPAVMHTAVDALDARALAEFYRELLGVRYRPGDEPPEDGPDDDSDWLVLVDDSGARVLAVQQVAELARPTWPSDAVPKQMHLDLRVPDRASLERHRDRAESLGAEVLLDRTAEETEPLYVLADPAGHPFCLLVSPG